MLRRILLLSGFSAAIATAAILGQPATAHADPECGLFNQWKNGWWPFNDFKHGGDGYPGEGWTADGQYDTPPAQFHANFEGGKAYDYHEPCEGGEG